MNTITKKPSKIDSNFFPRSGQFKTQPLLWHSFISFTRWIYPVCAEFPVNFIQCLQRTPGIKHCRSPTVINDYAENLRREISITKSRPLRIKLYAMVMCPNSNNRRNNFDKCLRYIWGMRVKIYNYC